MASQEASPLDPEMREMIQAFVVESLDALQDNEPKIERLSDGGNLEVVNSIFRVFHTIKGLCGFLNLRVLHDLTHEAETLLDLLRRSQTPADDPIVDLIYTLFDDIRALLAAINEAFTDEAFRDETVEKIAGIRTHIDRLNNPDQDATAPAPPQIKDEQDFDPDGLDDAAEILQKFVEQARELLESTEQNLLILEKDLTNRSRLPQPLPKRQPSKHRLSLENSSPTAFGSIPGSSTRSSTWSAN